MSGDNDIINKALENAFWDGLKGSATYTLVTAMQGKKVKGEDILVAGLATGTVSFIITLFTG
jgi:hypothetical protein